MQGYAPRPLGITVVQADPTANQAPADQFTLGHFLVGGAMARLGVSPLQSLLGSLLWELGEDWLKQKLPRVFPRAAPDSKANALVDMTAWILGYMWFASD